MSSTGYNPCLSILNSRSIPQFLKRCLIFSFPHPKHTLWKQTRQSLEVFTSRDRLMMKMIHLLESGSSMR